MKNQQICIQINGTNYPISKDKMIIGSAPHCDISLNDKTLSYYHAMIFIKDGEYFIKDLESSNGTFVNGFHADKNTFFSLEDNITLGELHFTVSSSLEKVDLELLDKDLITTQTAQDSKIYIPEKINDNDILIDGEYCNILFDDSTEFKHQQNDIIKQKINLENYIDTDNFEESFDLRNEKDGDILQVTTAINGNILEQYYYELKDQIILASGSSIKNHILVDTLESNIKKLPLAHIQNAQFKLCDIPGFTKVSDSHIQNGRYSIYFNKIEASDDILAISSLRRDKDFFKDLAIKFSSVALPLLLLLLVDITQEKKPEKQLSIIYKKPTTSEMKDTKLASKNPNNKKVNNGHKKTEQSKKKIAHSKKGAKTAPKKVAQAKPTKAPPKQQPKKAKTKAYKFNMASNINSMFAKSKSVSVSNSRSPSSIKTNSALTGNIATNVNGTSSNVVGKMGKDSNGLSSASFGSKGLSSKSGRDTAYIQTKTVVLGSMDPELLRKILQQYLPQFRHCYQQELTYNSDDIKGIVDLNFEISGSGKVGNINIRAKDSRFSKKGTNCMKKVLAIIDFPKPKGGGRVAVRQPLSFFSEKERS